MTSVSSRITKLERTIRKQAREQYVASVGADFAAAVARASGNHAAMTPLLDAHDCVIKAGAKSAEEAALERFLAEKAPDPAPLISLDALYNPVTVKVAANGERLPDTATEYVAVLLPQFDLLYTIGSELVDTWQKAVKAGAAVDLFDGAGKWQLWDDIEAGLTIDRSLHGPAVLEPFRAHTPTDCLWWTRCPLASSPSGSAFYVNLLNGGVNWLIQGFRGRVRAVRRVRASQF